jgi:hypothetical protein
MEKLYVLTDKSGNVVEGSERWSATEPPKVEWKCKKFRVFVIMCESLNKTRPVECRFSEKEAVSAVQQLNSLPYEDEKFFYEAIEIK